MSIDRIKKLIKETYSSINEMGRVGDEFNGYSVIINSEDHDPPHIHFFKDGELIAKIEIAEYYPELVSDLVVLWKSPKLKYFMLRDLIQWFSGKYTRKGKIYNITNLEASLNMWDDLRPN